MLEEEIGEDWTFAHADTQYLTHGFHPYPARMVPQIANRVITRYSKPGDLILDPFCGSGGVLVEAKLLGTNSVGVDINPLAVIIAKAKTTPIDSQPLMFMERA
jgi:DNA modification methylase